MSEPFTDYALLDIVRLVVAGAAAVLCLLVLRLAVRRWHNRGTDPDRYIRTSPLTMLSYAILLATIVVKRADSLGTPWSWYLVPVIVALIVGYVGVLRRVHLPLPWRRSR